MKAAVDALPTAIASAIAAAPTVVAAAAAAVDAAVTADGLLTAADADTKYAGIAAVDTLTADDQAKIVFGTYADGSLKRPWQPEVEGPNLAASPALPYALTRVSGGPAADGTPFRADVGAPVAGRYVRARFTVSSTATTENFGFPELLIRERAADLTILTEQHLFYGRESHDVTDLASSFDLAVGATTRYVDIVARTLNNYVGTITVTEATCCLLSQAPLRYINFSQNDDPFTDATAGKALLIDLPIIDRAKSNTGARVRVTLGGDSDLELAYVGASIISSRAYPDPPSADNALNGSSDIPAAYIEAPVHANNNGLIVNVKKADGTWELRGNTHGGETLRLGAWPIDVQAFLDLGDRVWRRAKVSKTGASARRVKVVTQTKYTRSDGLKFAHQDNTYTFFPDGMCRWDRDFRVRADIDVDLLFFIMNSFDVVKFPVDGRMGIGTRVLSSYVATDPTSYPLSAASLAGDTTLPLPVPGIPQFHSPAWIGSTIQVGAGGTMETRRVVGATGDAINLDAALTYAHAIGEPLKQVALSATLQAPTAIGDSALSTDTTFPTFGSVLVIGAGTDHEERRVLDPNGGGQPGVAGAAPYAVTVNEPLRYAHAAGETVAVILAGDVAPVGGTQNNWAAYREPLHGLVFGQIFDPATIASHVGISGHQTNPIRNTLSNYIAKLYTMATLDASEVTIPAGTAWTDTYYFGYLPSPDDSNWHSEIARRAALSPAALAALYPTA